jgi:hypothetical protein
MEFRYNQHAGATSAWRLVIEGHHLLMQENRSPTDRGGVATKWDSQIVFALEVGDEVVGALCWDNNTICNSFDVTLAYVEPSSRRLGVFRGMWEEMLKVARQNNVDRIQAPLRFGDDLCFTVLQKIGMLPKRVTMQFEGF